MLHLGPVDVLRTRYDPNIRSRIGGITGHGPPDMHPPVWVKLSAIFPPQQEERPRKIDRNALNPSCETPGILLQARLAGVAWTSARGLFAVNGRQRRRRPGDAAVGRGPHVQRRQQSLHRGALSLLVRDLALAQDHTGAVGDRPDHDGARPTASHRPAQRLAVHRDSRQHPGRCALREVSCPALFSFERAGGRRQMPRKGL
jgi:hypothetical protein